MFGIGGGIRSANRRPKVQRDDNNNRTPPAPPVEAPKEVAPTALSEDCIERLFTLMQGFPRGCTAQHLHKLYGEEKEECDALPDDWLYLMRDSGEFVVNGCVVKLRSKKLLPTPPHLNVHATPFQPKTDEPTPPPPPRKKVSFPAGEQLTLTRCLTPQHSDESSNSTNQQLASRLLLSQTPIEQLGFHVVYESLPVGRECTAWISNIADGVLYLQTEGQRGEMEKLAGELMENYGSVEADAAKLNRPVAAADMVSGAVFVCRPPASASWCRVLLLGMSDGVLVYAFDSGRQVNVPPATLRYITPDTLDTPALCYTCKPVDDERQYVTAHETRSTMRIECVGHVESGGRTFSQVQRVDKVQTTRDIIDERSTVALTCRLSPMPLDVNTSPKVIIVSVLDPHSLCLQLAVVQPAPSMMEHTMRRTNCAAFDARVEYNVGDLVCVLRREGEDGKEVHCYRGYVGGVTVGRSYKVWLVDIGVCAIETPKHLRRLGQDAMAAPHFFAIRASLSSIAPSSSSGWSTDAALAAKAMLSPSNGEQRTHEEFTFEIHRITSFCENGAPFLPHLHGDLVDRRGASISQRLVDAGYAKWVDA